MTFAEYNLPGMRGPNQQSFPENVSKALKFFEKVVNRNIYDIYEQQLNEWMVIKIAIVASKVASETQFQMKNEPHQVNG